MSARRGCSDGTTSSDVTITQSGTVRDERERRNTKSYSCFSLSQVQQAVRDGEVTGVQD